ncbi:MAG: hypothetical protein C0501_21390 [Isosphaera sp.]|nr:hypothetical protein [Isosphaera sp.]
MRAAAAVLLAAGVAAAQPAVTPTPVTLKKDAAPLGEVAAGLSKAPAGVAVTAGPRVVKETVPARFDGVPFWEALETAADRAKARLVVRDGGKTVALEPRPGGREVSAVSGPFRVVPRAVTGRLLLDGGGPVHEVELDVHWEPRMPVYRIDSQPKVTKAADDRGAALTAEAGSSRHHPAAAVTDLKVRLTGLTRDSKRIGVLAGEFRATAAAKLLTVPFGDLSGTFPQTRTVDGVKVLVRSFKKVGPTWDAEVELTYPDGHPHFESFEEQKWLRDTRLRLVDPTAAAWDADSEDVVAAGRAVAATYRFKVLANANPTAKGWSLVCETPAPLAEVTVPFVLKDVPIP